MCIIIAKPKGISLEQDVIRRCMLRNRDGGGFAVANTKHVQISKGYFHWEDLWLDIKPHMDKTMVIHCRIATSGTVNMSNCHPYPITRDVAKLAGCWVSCNKAFAHNGTVKWGGKKELKSFSDAALLVRDVVAPILETGNATLLDDVLTNLAEANASRFAIIDGEGNISTYGSGWELSDGVWYSNDSYQEYKRITYDYRESQWYKNWMKERDVK